VSSAGRIDFSQLRARHAGFVGRRDLQAEIDELLLQGTKWVLVAGGPGSGKSALLSHYLDRLETAQTAGVVRRLVSWRASDTADAGLRTLAKRLFTKKNARDRRIVPYHFLRYMHANWAAPTTVLKSLTDQLADLFPKCRDPKYDETDPRFLHELLKNASATVLQPEQQRVILVLDNIDRVDGENPTGALQTLLPSLPAGVSVLCSARPFYKALGWIECSGSFARVDLDDAAASNDATGRAFIQSQIGTLPSSFSVDDALRLSHGNLRYISELIASIADESETPMDPVPVGFTAYMEKLWRDLNHRYPEHTPLFKSGFWTISSSKEGLSLAALCEAAGWSSGEGEKFLHFARPLLREMATTGDPIYRPFHYAFRDHLIEKLSAQSGPHAAPVAAHDPAPVAAHDPAPGPAQSEPPAVVREPGPIRKRYALLVGVNTYPESPALKYCVNDAVKLAQTLDALGFSVITFHDDQTEKLLLPTIENIRAKLGAFKNGFDQDDLFLVFFSCHGMLSEGNAFLLGADSRPTDIEHSGLAMKTVMDFMKASGSHRNLLILDACHTGVDIGHGASDAPQNSASAQHMGIAPASLHSYASELGEGIAVLAGSSAAQNTLDWAAMKHSVFSYYVIDALSGAADTARKGFVTVNDLNRHTYDGVKDWWFKNFNGGHRQDVTARIEGAATGEIKVVELKK
jgi:hypothetical protein